MVLRGEVRDLEGVVVTGGRGSERGGDCLWEGAGGDGGWGMGDGLPREGCQGEGCQSVCAGLAIFYLFSRDSRFLGWKWGWGRWPREDGQGVCGGWQSSLLHMLGQGSGVREGGVRLCGLGVGGFLGGKGGGGGG